MDRFNTLLKKADDDDLWGVGGEKQKKNRENLTQNETFPEGRKE
jgi:hypothetical protein